MKVLAASWRALRAVLLGLAVVILFIEEWGWRPLAAVAARIGRWPPLARLERLIVRTSPRVALVLFLVPAVLLFPLKLGALWLMDQGHAMIGIAVIVAAKVLGTAFVGRLFILVEPQLMQFAWFARALRWSRKTRARTMARVHASVLWRSAAALRRAWRVWLRSVMH
ncbi:MAG: hypothetical protein ABJA61_02065 [Caldimonas sp.]